jgi:DNA modification methylase
MEETTDNRLDEPVVEQVTLPEQKQFFKIPARFGHVPVAEEPLGYDKERRFELHYPRIELPFQLVDTVETGAKKRYEKSELFPNGLNRLFFGDCLHVMRMLPSECIDLIYIDPPFFSGRNYNIIFGDKNEVRSFSDIWEGGMPGYLIWLNTRLYEMKRLLKLTGSIFVHLDWHASHYVKCELDRIFGHENFINEIVWYYSNKITDSRKRIFQRAHDAILFYARSRDYKWNPPYEKREAPVKNKKVIKLDGRRVNARDENGNIIYVETDVKAMLDVFDVPVLGSRAEERIGYPTQKPIEILCRMIEATTGPGDVVADIFCGGGSLVIAAQGARIVTTPGGSKQLICDNSRARRWIGCDISRVAVALTADRVARLLAPTIRQQKRADDAIRKGTGLFTEIVSDATRTSVEDARKKAVEASRAPLTGYTVEHWGIYEIDRLTELSHEAFRAFVLACYGARKWTGNDPNIHGVKQRELLWVAGPKESNVVTASDVRSFAHAVMSSRRPEERQAVMIGWGIDPKARAYADQVMALGERKPIQFIKLRLWPLSGEEFKSHICRKHDKYKDFLAFILPPDIPRIGITRLESMKYRFDVSEARSMNTGGKIVNVQWDFDFRDGIFSATQGFQLCRKEQKGGFEGEMTVEYAFEDIEPGTEVTIACRVQDDLGGEGMKVMKMKVE